MKTMRTKKRSLILALILFFIGIGPVGADVFIQCPGDTNGDNISDDPNIKCVQLAAGDGFATMADGYPLYTFGFHDVTGMPASQILENGILSAEFPGPTVVVKEGQEMYLTLINVGLMMRPDLFDPHSLHFHGFPQASTVFDGEPMSTFAINMGSSLTYYYNVVEPGTYMYHCHVEATEHMQMGMLANIYVTPAQDGTSKVYNGRTYTKFAYNDGDGSTGYDVSLPLQINAFDSNFHDQHIAVQPLPFSDLEDDYVMFNGRGYPDTINTGNILTPNDFYPAGYAAQKVNSLITATSGERILLHISNLSFDFKTLTCLGVPMQVVGKDAKILRGPTGLNLYYGTNTLNLGGGETADVILDTAGVAPGRYFLYTTNLNYLSNNTQERGGLMTEIIIN